MSKSYWLMKSEPDVWLISHQRPINKKLIDK